jgi:hypothetical protein
VTEPRAFYDPNAVEVSLGGLVITGFADGTMVEVAQAADDYETKVGTKGAVGVTRIHNPMREVKLRLLKTSPSNDQLNALRLAGRRLGSRGFASIFSLRDGSGSAKLTGPAYVKRPPNQVFSNTAEAYEWTLDVIVGNEADETIGGNRLF